MRCAWLLLLVLACSARNEVPYGGCAASSLCAEATPRCVSFFNRVNGQRVQLCTLPCVASADCPARGVCVTTETTGVGSLCVQRCEAPEDCRFAGAHCAFVRAGEQGCVP